MKYLAAGLLIAAGCAADAPTPEPEPQPEPQAAAPKLNLLLTAGPTDFESVWVNLSNLQIRAADRTLSSMTDGVQGFELVDLQNGMTAPLASVSLEPGSYDGLFLVVDSASVTMGGVAYEADMAQYDVALDLNTTLESNMVYNVTLVYDITSSVSATDTGYAMAPVMQVGDVVATAAAYLR